MMATGPGVGSRRSGDGRERRTRRDGPAAASFHRRMPGVEGESSPRSRLPPAAHASVPDASPPAADDLTRLLEAARGGDAEAGRRAYALVYLWTDLASREDS